MPVVKGQGLDETS